MTCNIRTVSRTWSSICVLPVYAWPLARSGSFPWAGRRRSGRVRSRRVQRRPETWRSRPQWGSVCILTSACRLRDTFCRRITYENLKNLDLWDHFDLDCMNVWVSADPLCLVSLPEPRHMRHSAHQDQCAMVSGPREPEPCELSGRTGCFCVFWTSEAQSPSSDLIVRRLDPNWKIRTKPLKCFPSNSL